MRPNLLFATASESEDSFNYKSAAASESWQMCSIRSLIQRWTGISLHRNWASRPNKNLYLQRKPAEISQPAEELLHDSALNNAFPIALNKATPTNCGSAGAAGVAAPDCCLIRTSYYILREVVHPKFFEYRRKLLLNQSMNQIQQ